MTPTRDIAVQLCHWYLANDYAEAAGTTKAMETSKDPFKELLFKPNASLPHDKVVQSQAHFGKRLQNLQGDITIGRGKDKRSAVKGLTFQNPFDLSKQQAPAKKPKVPDFTPEQLEEARAWALKTGMDVYDYQPEEHKRRADLNNAERTKSQITQPSLTIRDKLDAY